MIEVSTIAPTDAVSVYSIRVKGTQPHMTIAEINAEITKIREERDALANREKALTSCIETLARKREMIREEIQREESGQTLFDDMFGG